MTENVETALNEFFEENNKCAKLYRFEIMECRPIGIDLTKQIIAQKEKVASIINAESSMQKANRKSESDLYYTQQLAYAEK